METEASATVPAENDAVVMTAREATNEILIEALASGRSYTQAGELAGVTSRTVARRMADPAFARQVSERRAAWAMRTAGELVSMGSEAIAVLRELLVDAERPAELVAEPAVEGVDPGVLPGVAVVDEDRVDATEAAPVGDGCGDELGAVVEADERGVAPLEAIRPRVATTRSASMEWSTTMAGHSWVYSSMTLRSLMVLPNVLRRRPCGTERRDQRRSCSRCGGRHRRRHVVDIDPAAPHHPSAEMLTTDGVHEGGGGFDVRVGRRPHLRSSCRSQPPMSDVLSNVPVHLTQ